MKTGSAPILFAFALTLIFAIPPAFSSGGAHDTHDAPEQAAPPAPGNADVTPSGGWLRPCFDLLTGQGLSAARQEMKELEHIRDYKGPRSYVKALLARSSEHDLEKMGPLYRWAYKRRVKSAIKFRIINDNDLPAIFNFGKDDDTLGVLSGLLDRPMDHPEYKKALHTLHEWIAKYKKYEERLLERADKGYSALHQIEELEAFLEARFVALGLSKNSKVTLENFKKVFNKPVQLTKFVHGKANLIEEPFDLFAEYMLFIKERKRRVTNVFGRNILDVTYRTTEIYEELLEQAKIARRLELIRNELNNGTREIPGSDNDDVVAELNHLLADEELAARPDATRAFLSLEEKAEKKADKWQPFRGHFTRKRRDKSAHNIIKERLVRLASKKWRLKIVEPLQYAFITSMVATHAFVIHHNFTGHGPSGVVYQTVMGWSDDAKRMIWGYTPEEAHCVENDEFFFGVCYTRELVPAYLGAELAAARSSHENILDTPEIKEKLQSYRTHILELRRHFKNAKLIAIAEDDLNNLGYLEVGIDDIGTYVGHKVPSAYASEEVKAIILNQNELQRGVQIANFKSRHGIDLTNLVNMVHSSHKEIATSWKLSARMTDDWAQKVDRLLGLQANALIPQPNQTTGEQ